MSLPQLAAAKQQTQCAVRKIIWERKLGVHLHPAPTLLCLLPHWAVDLTTHNKTPQPDEVAKGHLLRAHLYIRKGPAKGPST